MRITSKGQVTIPIELRRQAGFLPNTEVEFVLSGDRVFLRRSDDQKGRGRKLVERMRSAKPSIGLTTDEIMALTRGDD